MPDPSPQLSTAGWPRGVGATKHPPRHASSHATAGDRSESITTPAYPTPTVRAAGYPVLMRRGGAHPRCATPATNAAARVVAIVGVFIPILRARASPARPSVEKHAAQRTDRCASVLQSNAARGSRRVYRITARSVRIETRASLPRSHAGRADPRVGNPDPQTRGVDASGEPDHG